MARQSTKADVESAVAKVLNDVKLIKKETSQIAGLKASVDLMIVYLKTLGARMDDNIQEAVIPSSVVAEKIILLNHADCTKKFLSLDKLLDDIFMQFPLMKNLSYVVVIISY
jgi:hypothetical protein